MYKADKNGCLIYIYIYVRDKSQKVKYHSQRTINENSPPFHIHNMLFLHRHRKLERLPFKCHCHYGESTVTIQGTPDPRKGHHQISTADLPANMQSNCIVMLNTQYVKYHI
jgi:hypothetical protein